MFQKQFSFWVLTAALMIFLVVPVLIMDGMFMDGMLYACVAKNLSEGSGTFWQLHNSPFTHNQFDQQPPLGIGIQALFFLLLGDGMYTERIHAFFTLCSGAMLIRAIWRQVFHEDQSMKAVAWFPVILWIIIPVCFWAYSNNMLEGTMVIFDLLAVLFLLKFFEKESIGLLIISGMFIFLASLTKGFQGLFPLAAIVIYGLTVKRSSPGKMILYSAILFMIPATIYGLILLNEHARFGLTAYLNNRVLHSITSVSNVDHRFSLLLRLAQELILPAALATVLFMIFRKRNPLSSSHKQYFLFFLLIGVSASFPLIVTLEQRGFYLVTSLPFYALALAMLPASGLARAISEIPENARGLRLFRWFAILLLAASIIFSAMQIGKYSRDEEMLHDVYVIGNAIPPRTQLGSSKELWQNWSLQEYFIRHYYDCISAEMTTAYDYILIDSPEKIPTDLQAEKLHLPTKKYHLYKVIK